MIKIHQYINVDVSLFFVSQDFNQILTDYHSLSLSFFMVDHVAVVKLYFDYIYIIFILKIYNLNFC